MLLRRQRNQPGTSLRDLWGVRGSVSGCHRHSGQAMIGVVGDIFGWVLRDDTIDVAEDGHGMPHAMASVDSAKDLSMMSL